MYFPGFTEDKICIYVWIGDASTFTHMITNEEGFVTAETENIKYLFQVKDGTTIHLKTIKKWKVFVINSSSKKPMKISSKETMCLYNLKINLF